MASRAADLRVHADAAPASEIAGAAEALARSATTPDEHDLVAQLLSARGDPQGALRHAERSLALAPGGYLVYAARARLALG